MPAPISEEYWERAFQIWYVSGRQSADNLLDKLPELPEGGKPTAITVRTAMERLGWKTMEDYTLKLSNNVLSRIFDWLGEAFEKFNPSAYRFLGASLPYLTPLPVAWLTSNSARDFLGFTPGIAFTFVFSLEGIGLWFTSLLVDAVVDWIRSRNWKTFAIVAVLSLAVGSYIYLLVSLNVLLHTDTENSVYRQVVTLLCFLPLISGIGNGYYKIKMKHDAAEADDKQYQRELEERKRQEANELKLKSRLIKAGINPLQVVQYNTQSPTVEPPAKKSDWRLLTDNEKHQVRTSLTIQEIMDKYDVSRSTAFGWKSK